MQKADLFRSNLSLSRIKPKPSRAYKGRLGGMQAQLAGAFSQPGTLLRLSEISDRNRTCQPRRITPHPDVQPGPLLGKRFFQGGAMCPCQGTPSTSSECQQS